MPSLAASAANVPRSRIRELANIAMGMEGVLRLYFGESNLPTPAYIKEAAVRALEDGYTYYTENAGYPSLRRAIAQSLATHRKAQIEKAREAAFGLLAGRSIDGLEYQERIRQEWE